MLLGIDVGGTFTDAVVLRQGEVVAQAKRATTHDDVLQCVLAALDAVLQPGMAQKSRQERQSRQTCQKHISGN